MTDNLGIPDLPADPAARRALLAERLRERIAVRGHVLSYPQQRLWFLAQLDPGNPVYVVPMVYRINGPLDLTALEYALTELVRRHHVLRTTFRLVDGEPRQFVQPASAVTVDVRDAADGTEAEQICADEARTAFDLETDLMVRPLLVRLGRTEHRLCLTLHHLVCDGASLGIIGRELSALYRAHQTGEAADLPEPALQYAEYAERQHARLAGPGLAEMLGYWRDRLAGAPVLATLPTDRPRPPVQSHRGGHVPFTVGAAPTAGVTALARDSAATPFAVLLAAFGVLTHGYTGAQEAIVGSPVAGRTTEAIRPLIGFFTNTVVQRLDLSGDPTFRELVARTRDEARLALAHQELPFEKLVEELHPSRDTAHNPVFQLMVSHQEGEQGELVLPGCEVRMVPGDTESAKFDLTLGLTSTGDTLSGRLEYATDLFDPATAHRLARHFTTVLSAAVSQPDARISTLPLLSAEESQHLLAGLNPLPVPVPDALVHELIAQQAARTPDAPALMHVDDTPDQALTYREMDARAEALAARLRAGGVGPDIPVAVYLHRGPDLVVTLLAILKAGGAYLPLDPGYPHARLAFMVADAQARIVVTSATLAQRATRLPARALLVDEPGDDGAPPVAPAALTPDNLAYVIYTSGSTGTPKGVMVTHRNVGNFFAGMDPLVPGAGPASWLAVTSMSFDISVLELLWTLARGHRVVLRGDEPTRTTAPGGGTVVPAAAQARTMDFSLFYFGGDRGGDPADRYRLLIEGAKFADRHGFHAVWTPERHFHEFGGLYPNPAVTGAAVAAITDRVQIRAGSVVLPLHDPLRVAEEWSVLDNLSGGRVGVSVASGWQPDDFVLAPDNYADRKQAMLDGVATLRRLWRGDSLTRRNGVGRDVDVSIFPPPVQRDLPVWITSARSPETFRMAGEIGAGLLTHMLGHSAEQLAEKITLYRQAWRDAGHPGDGRVTVMLHTFVGADTDEVREIVREPLCAYIKSSLDLLSGLGAAMGDDTDPRTLPPDELDLLVARAFERFFDTSGLLGTPEHCADLIDQLKAIGVDEAACLIDFGVPHEQVLEALGPLRLVRELSEDRSRRARADEPIAAQIRRHGITHLQCTPSVAGLMVDDEDAAALGELTGLLVGGEALPDPLADVLAKSVPAVRSMYGPTEVTVWATSAEVNGRPVVLGEPMANTRAYVVDAHLRPTPPGVPGELLLGGLGVTRGYLGRPALTAGRFIPDPFSGIPGQRLYRTGDLVRRDAEGALWFLGRLDHQVKLHGHRIELGEIENVVAAHPGLRAAVVVVRGENAGRRIVAYGVAANEATPPGAEEIRAFCARTLPDYMVPADVVLLDRLPSTPNGKVARDALPEPGRQATREYQPPEGDAEGGVARVFAEVVGAERVGAHDNFFEIGGNSLLAVRLRTLLVPVLGDRVSLVDIFRYPTVRGLVSASVAQRTDAGVDRARESAGRRAAAFARRRAGRDRA